MGLSIRIQDTNLCGFNYINKGSVSTDALPFAILFSYILLSYAK